MGVEAGWSLCDTPRLTVWHLEEATGAAGIQKVIAPSGGRFAFKSIQLLSLYECCCAMHFMSVVNQQNKLQESKVKLSFNFLQKEHFFTLYLP